MMKQLLKNRFFRILSIIFVVGLAIFFYLYFLSPRIYNHADFYPVTDPKQDSLEIAQVKKLFNQKRYLSITTYVDDVLEILSDNEKELALFYQGESYFLLKQYSMSLKTFFLLFGQSPKMWQAPLRLASIQIINKNYKTVGDLLGNINQKSYEYYYWYGRYLVETGKVRTGIRVLKDADGSSASVNYQIGTAYQKIKKNKDARYYFIKALDPNFENYIQVLENLFNMAVEVGDLKNLSVYEESLAPFYREDKNLAERVARSFVRIGDKKKAYEVYSIFMSENNLSPRIAEVLFNLAYDIKNYTDVVRFSQSFALTKEHQIKLALALSEDNRARNAIILSRNLLKSPSINAKDRFQLQQILFSNYKKIGAPGEAIKVAKTMVAENKDKKLMLELLEMYSQVYYTYKDSHNALTKSIYDMDKDSLKTLIIHYQKKGYKEEQLKFLNYVLEKDPSSVEALYYKANNLFQTGKIDEVKSALFALLNLPNDNQKIFAESSYSLGSIHLSEQNYSEAIVWLLKSDMMIPKSQAKLKLALSYFYVGDTTSATSYIQQIKRERGEKSLSPKELNLFDYLDTKLNMGVTDGGFSKAF